MKSSKGIVFAQGPALVLVGKPAANMNEAAICNLAYYFRQPNGHFDIYLRYRGRSRARTLHSGRRRVNENRWSKRLHRATNRIVAIQVDDAILDVGCELAGRTAAIQRQCANIISSRQFPQDRGPQHAGRPRQYDPICRHRATRLSFAYFARTNAFVVSIM